MNRRSVHRHKQGGSWVARCIGGVGAAALVSLGTLGAAGPALASRAPAVCGPGVNAGGCPPLCVKLMPASAIAKIFHVRGLTKANWHVDGEPQDTCTYALTSDSSSTLSDTVDSKETVAAYNNRVKITKEFQPKAKIEKVRALGADAVMFVDCMGSDMCFPSFVVFSKGYLVQAQESLNGVPAPAMAKTYVPEMIAWIKAIEAKI